MNYLNGELNWTFQPNQALCFYGDNTMIENGNISMGYSVRDYIRNFSTLNNKGMPDMVYLPFGNTSGCLFFNVKMDYIYYSVANYQIELKLITLDDFENELYGDVSIIDQTDIYLKQYDDYLDFYADNDCFSYCYYGQYKTNFNNSRKESVFDLSRMQYYFNDIQYDDIESHVFNAINSRPDNSLYYRYCLYMSGSNMNTNTITIKHASDKMGSAIYNSWQTAMETGYTNGYGNGYADGYADGYNTNVDHETLNAFNYISQAFTAVSDVLAIQILPHVTLGLVFSIPMVFTLILLTFKLVKK